METVSVSTEQHVVIKFLTNEGATPSEIFARLKKQFGIEERFSRHETFLWCARYKNGPGGGTEPTLVTPENIQRAEKIILKNRKITCNQIGKKLGISKAAVTRIIKDHLRLRNINNEGWAPRKRLDQVERTESSVLLPGSDMVDESFSSIKIEPTEPTLATPENIQQVEKIILKNRQLTRNQIAKELGISKAAVTRIVHDHLGLRYFNHKGWVPRKRLDQGERTESSIAPLGSNIVDQGEKTESLVLPPGSDIVDESFSSIKIKTEPGTESLVLPPGPDMVDQSFTSIKIKTEPGCGPEPTLVAPENIQRVKKVIPENRQISFSSIKIKTEPGCGTEPTLVTPENIQRVEKIIPENRQISFCSIKIKNDPG